MDNKECNSYLNKLEEVHAKKFRNDKDYLESCKANKDLNPKDYKIIPNHKLEEYFKKYGNKLESGKLLAFKKDELWLMNKNTKYWKIENESDFIYFEAPNNLKPLWISLIALLAAGGIAGGVTAGVLLNKGNNSGSGGEEEPEEYKGLRFTAEESNSKVGYDKNGSVNTSGIEYSLHSDANNDITWVPWTDGADVDLSNGEIMFVRNINSSLSTSDDDYINFTMSGTIKASGNINSMINYNELSEYCYAYMFFDCYCLISAPELPAVQLAENCYYRMFEGSAITSAPELPATELKDNCYSGMFRFCEELVSTPELPSTQLVDGCYNNMFNNCSSLKVKDNNRAGDGTKIFTCEGTSSLENAVNNMFVLTAGSFDATPSDGVTYYWYTNDPITHNLVLDDTSSTMCWFGDDFGPLSAAIYFPEDSISIEAIIIAIKEEWGFIVEDTTKNVVLDDVKFNNVSIINSNCVWNATGQTLTINIGGSISSFTSDITVTAHSVAK